MAKTHCNLWPQVVSWDNLLLAYRKCRRRKRYKPAAARFDHAWETNLLQVQRDLIDGTYRPGAYRNFYVLEPKKRKISAASFHDRVVHHAVVNVLEPIYERRFLADSYACRKGRGTHRAVGRAQHYLRRYAYYLKTDIIRFFPNVDHEVLMQVIGRQIRDDRLLQLIAVILKSGVGVLDDEATPEYFPGDDLFALSRPTGLPIGNLTSQFFANVLLDPIDHFVKEQLRVPGYVRYADDLVLFADDKKFLWECHAALVEQLEKMRLRLHPDKTYVRPCRLDLKFLGFRLYRDGRRLLPRNYTRFTRRLRRLRWLKANGFIHSADIARSVSSWLAYARHANHIGMCRVLRRRLRV